MIGSIVISYFAGDRPDGRQLAGYMLAVAGVVLAAVPLTPARS
jgi:drug/metabolite transporter (DMT)-like permease